jgi:hypothetical protein
MRKISWEVAATAVRKYKMHVIKGKVFPVHVMKKYGGGGEGGRCTVPVILSVSTKWK